MPRSARLHKERKAQVIEALKRNGFLTQGDLAAHLEVALSTINNFINSKPVYITKFEEICHALNLDKQAMLKPLNEEVNSNLASQEEIEKTSLFSFIAYDDYWVGRKDLITSLTEKLQGAFRFLFILGLTGIGKTALAERIILERQKTSSLTKSYDFKRVNFEALGNATDFMTVAIQWLEAWEIQVPSPQRNPEQVIWHLTQYLQHNTVLLLFDSFENLLGGNEEEGWGNLADNWWEKFFLSLLSAQSCQTRIIITSQDLPLSLVEQRYNQYWHCHLLTGLDENEQENLWEIIGFNIDDNLEEKALLMRLGKAYQGHPLVLRVISGEIWESFGGNVKAYWEDVKSKIETVETALAEAENEAQKQMGSEDNWKLHKLTRKVRLEVNKQRLTSVFNRLEAQSTDAYYLICAASVYRVPVQVQGWLMQLAVLIKRIENQFCNEERQEMALEELCYRFLVEESVNPNNQRVLGLHHLIRSVALEHYQQLITKLKQQSKTA
ncbi:NB-ARC domain-containing protein [Gloeothece verrucosa]|uniref:Uncharacterized protein n=1 Tax=Gloeothece verrucosa (strain PCC 7822) TaxID=497965 RepID=E0UM18_GLOV7|nr:NB-ARC domain-containing protein [Gloeothece verrucosa]ADN17998.1 conserved hypothetical protein [Gloeothece verrucosa PCC 7822]